MSPAEGAAARVRTAPAPPPLRQRPPSPTPRADPDRADERLLVQGSALPAAGAVLRPPITGSGRQPVSSRPATPATTAAPEEARRPAARSTLSPATGRGIRLNGPWCALLLIVGVAAALTLAGALGWQPGVRMTIVLVVVGVGVALLAGRAGAFEAAVLPGTVVIVVGALLIAADRSGLGGVVGGLGTFGRIWQVIGLLAPAAAATWVCALTTLALRRAGLIRRF